MTTMNFAQLRGALPHRHPFLLLDRVTASEAGVSLTARKCISGNEPCYAGLGDELEAGALAYPQTLLVEAFLQAAGLMLLEALALPRVADDMLMLFGSLADCVFAGDALPGDVLELQLSLDRLFPDSAMASGRICVDGRELLRIGRVVVALRPLAGAGAAATPA
ncbi:beta-hydroxyacyl-ACP dehydratase [Oxalobacteraceae bacterium]|nr:beta-hydroxyacyl-ACP dehydratase [Oxalobacteraceae bacterium]